MRFAAADERDGNLRIDACAIAARKICAGIESEAIKAGSDVLSEIAAASIRIGRARGHCGPCVALLLLKPHSNASGRLAQHRIQNMCRD